MKAKQVEQLIFGVILLLPALFLSGFAIHDALEPTVNCQQACQDLNTEFVACDDDVCFCDPNDGAEPVHVTSVEHRGAQRAVECSE